LKFFAVQKFQDKRDESMKRKYFRMLKKDGAAGSKNPNLIPLGESKPVTTKSVNSTDKPRYFYIDHWVIQTSLEIESWPDHWRRNQG
jgi:hypothetical protein